MRMLAGVIFDFDGVIVDTEPLHYRAFQKILEPLGLGYGWDTYVADYLGFDDRDAFREAFRSRGRPLSGTELEPLIEQKAQAFLEIIAAGVRPYPGAVELIAGISGRLPLAICSGALRSDILPVLEQFGLGGVFDVIVTADDVTASKPDPACYRLTVERLSAACPGKGIAPESCIVIEDTPGGIAAARGAGLVVVGVTTSYPADRLAGTARIVTSLEELTPDDLALLV
jgi:HAD superfamily hydrolase (TIGR01509 family)